MNEVYISSRYLREIGRRVNLEEEEIEDGPVVGCPSLVRRARGSAMVMIKR